MRRRLFYRKNIWDSILDLIEWVLKIFQRKAVETVTTATNTVETAFRDMSRPKILSFVRYCSEVRNHAWYESSAGLIRKPAGQMASERS